MPLSNGCSGNYETMKLGKMEDLERYKKFMSECENAVGAVNSRW